jgi:hypothetical protein
MINDHETIDGSMISKLDGCGLKMRSGVEFLIKS